MTGNNVSHANNKTRRNGNRICSRSEYGFPEKTNLSGCVLVPLAYAQFKSSALKPPCSRPQRERSDENNYQDAIHGWYGTFLYHYQKSKTAEWQTRVT
jgi:hypothetical protein